MIYLIHAVGTHYFKIGVASNPKKRLTDLQCASPHELKLLTTREGDQGLEQVIHFHFETYRKHVRGEWFCFASVEIAIREFTAWTPQSMNDAVDERSRNMWLPAYDGPERLHTVVSRRKLSSGNVRA
jgi:hypothetical protein